jgi:hypothetical protein
MTLMSLVEHGPMPARSRGKRGYGLRSYDRNVLDPDLLRAMRVETGDRGGTACNDRFFALAEASHERVIPDLTAKAGRADLLKL